MLEDLVNFSITWSHLKGKNRAVGKSLESMKQHMPFFVSSGTEKEQHNFRKERCYQILESKYPSTEGQVTEQLPETVRRERRKGGRNCRYSVSTEIDFTWCCQIAFSVEGFSSLSSYSDMVQKGRDGGWAEQNLVSKKEVWAAFGQYFALFAIH